jgi:signal transduction histidine kinase
MQYHIDLENVSSPSVHSGNSLYKLWQKISLFGLPISYQGDDRKNIILANQLNFILLLVVGVYCLITLGLGYTLIGVCDALFLGIFLTCCWLNYKGYFLYSRLLGVFMQYNLLLISMIFAGSGCHMEDFLITTAMMPIMMFGKKHLKFIFMFMFQCLFYYFIYDTYRATFDHYALPIAQQKVLGAIIIPAKVITLFLTMYLILRGHLETETEFEARQRVLEAQRNYYFNMLEHVPFELVVYDRNYRYTYVNRNSYRDKIMGAWIIGKTDEDYVKFRNLDPQLAKDRVSILRQSADERRAVFREEAFINKDGKYHTAIKGSIPMFDNETGELTEFFCYSMNITPLKETEKKLQDSLESLKRVNEELKQFGYIVSHDLKTPLRNISTYLQILKRNVPLDKESNTLIEQSVNSVKHMNEMIQDIFTYASSEQANMNRDNIDINKIINIVKENMMSELDSRGASVNIVSQLPLLHMNRTHALHLFSNLITNGIKYNESPQPVVEIGTEVIDGLHYLYVRDNGIGIKPEYQAQVFELFKRLHGPSSEYEGTGVGLSLCKKITSIYKGTIEVISVEGQGAKFRFALPAALITNSDLAVSHTHIIAMQHKAA